MAWSGRQLAMLLHGHLESRERAKKNRWTLFYPIRASEPCEVNPRDAPITSGMIGAGQLLNATGTLPVRFCRRHNIK
jgi:hypothetical protein